MKSCLFRVKVARVARFFARIIRARVELPQQFLQFGDIAARYGDGIVAVTHDELHGVGTGRDLLHLAEIDEEGAMAAHYHGVGLQTVFQLLHRGAEHVGMHLVVSLLADLCIVANRLNIQQVRNLQADTLIGGPCERKRGAELRGAILPSFGGGGGSLQLLQLLVHQPCLLQFSGQIAASEFEPPVESDGEGEESDDCKRLQIIAQRQFVALYHAAHDKVAVEADKQRHQRRVDELKAEIAGDDVVDATVVGTGHVDDEVQDDFCQEAAEHAQGKQTQQMDDGLPAPHFESEGLEDGQCQHHEGDADDADADGFFVTFVHTAGKGNKKYEKRRVNDGKIFLHPSLFGLFAPLSQLFEWLPPSPCAEIASRETGIAVLSWVNNYLKDLTEVHNYRK